mmetsp:Transcript_32513/g.74751  ORF Transcript_32513/g.74751 Transcript_32513/m.74751 type:complete len:150 (-) Transcript_32513:588-1037(-)
MSRCSLAIRGTPSQNDVVCKQKERSVDELLSGWTIPGWSVRNRWPLLLGSPRPTNKGLPEGAAYFWKLRRTCAINSVNDTFQPFYFVVMDPFESTRTGLSLLETRRETSVIGVVPRSSGQTFYDALESKKYFEWGSLEQEQRTPTTTGK